MMAFVGDSKMTSIKGIVLSVSLALTASSVAGAADFDGSRDLLCVPTDAIQCEGAGECKRVSVEEVNLPRFVNIDMKKEQLRGKVLGGEEETTAIENIRHADGRTILQGSENSRGWSITIDHNTGDMSAAIAGDDIGFILFGVCQID
jgi:hypothetical protein